MGEVGRRTPLRQKVLKDSENLGPKTFAAFAQELNRKGAGLGVRRIGLQPRNCHMISLFHQNAEYVF